MPSAHQVVIVTGASSGFGRLAATSLARAGHTVVASMRATTGRNQPVVAELATLAEQESMALFTADLDVQSQESVDAALAGVVATHGRLDVVVHNAGHMVLGPTEAFTSEQLAEQYDTNVLGTHRVNRAALPHLRAQRSGLLVWVGSSSTRGGHPPFLGPYFAAKAAMDALAESYAAELIRFGIDTSIVIPGAYTEGTNHFAHAGAPADGEREREYDDEYADLRASLNDRLAALIPAGSDVQAVADEIVRIVDLPAGRRPFRSHLDPSKDGSHVASVVYDRLRHEFYHRVGIEELLPADDAL